MRRKRIEQWQQRLHTAGVKQLQIHVQPVIERAQQYRRLHRACDNARHTLDPRRQACRIAQTLLVKPAWYLRLQSGREPILGVLIVKERERLARHNLASGIAARHVDQLDDAQLKRRLEHRHLSTAAHPGLHRRRLVDLVDRSFMPFSS